MAWAMGACVIISVALVETRAVFRRAEAMQALVAEQATLRALPSDGGTKWNDVQRAVDANGVADLARRVECIGVVVAFLGPLVARSVVMHRAAIALWVQEWHRQLRDARYVIGRRLIERDGA